MSSSLGRDELLLIAEVKLTVRGNLTRSIRFFFFNFWFLVLERFPL